MRYALIRSGVVENVIELDAGETDFLARMDAGLTAIVVSSDTPVGPGWTYDGILFLAPDLDTPVPSSVTNVQARLAMLNAGLLDDATAALTAMGEEAMIEWDHSVVIHRDSPLVADAAAALGLTDAQVDALFVAASAL